MTEHHVNPGPASLNPIVIDDTYRERKKDPKPMRDICDRAYLIDGKILCDGRMRCEHQESKINEMGLPFPYVLCGKAEEMLDELRSRPHTSSTETSGKYVCSPNCDFFGDCSALDKRACRKDQKQHEHDTAIRNETLDKPDKLALHEAKTRSIKQGGLAFVTVQMWIESLRSTKEQP